MMSQPIISLLRRSEVLLSDRYYHFFDFLSFRFSMAHFGVGGWRHKFPPHIGAADNMIDIDAPPWAITRR